MAKKPLQGLTSGGSPVVKEPEASIETKRKELTEAMKKDMADRAERARVEIDAVCKRFRVEIVSMPNVKHMGNGHFAMIGQTIIKPLE